MPKRHFASALSTEFCQPINSSAKSIRSLQRLPLTPRSRYERAKLPSERRDNHRVSEISRSLQPWWSNASLPKTLQKAVKRSSSGAHRAFAASSVSPLTASDRGPHNAIDCYISVHVHVGVRVHTIIPGWGETMALPTRDGIRAFLHPAQRQRLAACAEAALGRVPAANWDRLTVTQVYTPENEVFAGRNV